MPTHPNFEPVVVYNQTSLDVGDLLYRSARMAGRLTLAGQGLNNSESAEFLSILNAMVDGWKIESLLIEYTRRTEQPAYIGQQDYSVGPGQDWDLERPEKIHRAGFIIPGGNPPATPAEIAMRIILNFEDWADYTTKQVQSNYPLALYYKAAAPYGQATLWPVPNADSFVAIYTPQLLSEFLTVDDVVYLRDGWREMLLYNLAVAIHEVYPKGTWDPSVAAKAAWYKDRAKNMGLTPIFAKSDAAARQNNSRQPYVGGQPRLWIPWI